MSAAKIKILYVGVEAILEPNLLETLGGCEIVKIPFDVDVMMDEVSPLPQMIMCGPAETAGLQSLETAQTLRMIYSEAPIYFISTRRDGFERALFRKNGFTDAFILPFDNDLLKVRMEEDLQKFGSPAAQTFRSVKMIDIQPGTVLDFDTTLYLPANKKYVKYSAAGDELDPSRAAKLKKHNVQSVFIDSTQIKKFYEYSAKRLAELSNGPSFSSTEKRERLQGAVRDLFSGIFTDPNREGTFEVGQQMAKDCAEIVNTFILSNPENDWYKRLIEALGDRATQYSHSTNVSTFAALFSIGLNIGKPAELAMAGMLHDIGKVELPPDIQMKKEEDMTPEELLKYQQHPLLSVDLIKRRKLLVPENLQKAIAQHHERYNGSGYPKQLVGDRITKEAQILGLADELDYLTSIQSGKRSMTPLEAIQYLRKKVVKDPSQMQFNPDLLKKILALFPVETDPTPSIN